MTEAEMTHTGSFIGDSYAPVMCVMGPTASGKSALAEGLACKLGGEIISADSMQIYKGMDIGTAKIVASKRRVPYHCIDILEPDQSYSAALFQADARKAIDSISARKKRAILCGGCGLYLRSVIDDMHFAEGKQQNNVLRQYYTDFLEKRGVDALFSELKKADPVSAKLIHPHNTRRVIRALEMHAAGESYATRKLAFKNLAPYYPSIKLALFMRRDILYERINARVDTMIADGLVDEVVSLLDRGFKKSLTSPQALGYKEIVAYLEGASSLESAIERIKQRTRRYAKRQMAWFRADKTIHWLDVTELSFSQTLEAALKYCDTNTSDI